MFNQSDFEIFTDANARNPALNFQRAQVRDKLLRLHESLYAALRERRWDLHPNASAQNIISPARVSSAYARITALTLQYGKAETTRHLMRREFGNEYADPARNAALGLRADARGLSLEFLIGEEAVVDAQNLQNKLIHGAPQKLQLRQILAELAPFTLTLSEPIPEDAITFARRQVLRAKCSRLVNLAMLNAAFTEFVPGLHELRVAYLYPVADARLTVESFASDLWLRAGQLYTLYQFSVWSPRNNFVERPTSRQAAEANQ
jgi:hypothetical protein